MRRRRPYALLLVITMLLVVGAIFWFAINSLTEEFSVATKPAKGSGRGGKSVSVAALRTAI